MWGQILENNLRVEAGSNTYTIDRAVNIITIVNNTGEFIDRIHTSRTDFTVWQDCHTGPHYNFGIRLVELENGESLKWLETVFRPIHIRLLGEEGQYTIFDINVWESVSVTFTENDRDGFSVSHPTELEDFNLFPIQISFRMRPSWSDVSIRWASRNFITCAYLPKLSFYIDANNLNLDYFGQFINYPFHHHWSVRYDINYGYTYQFKLVAKDHHIYEFEEVFYFTFPNDLIINAPEIIDNEPIYLSWELYPNYRFHTSLKTLTIIALDSTWYHRFQLDSSQREITIPEGFIPSLANGQTTFRLDYTSYATSGMVSIRDSGVSSVLFIDGIRQ
jgi:hypothetical protein